FFFSSRRRHTRFDCDWSSDVCSSDLGPLLRLRAAVRDVRRRGGVHLPLGRPARGPAGLRAGRDDHLHRHPGAGPALRLAQAGAAVGVVEKGKVPKPLTYLLNMSRKYSLWVYSWW